MPSSARTRIQVMDTTLRDGEQTPEISYTPAEKLQLAQTLLEDVGVDRIEIAGTRVSEGEREAARQICAWAKKRDLLPRIEMLGYVDGTQSIDWLESTGGRVMNLLTKGSERHCLQQLRMPPEQHRKRIADVLAYARKRKVKMNVYLEDWSQGVKDSPDYVFSMMRTLVEHDVARVYLADTLGIQAPRDTARSVDLMVASWPDVHFEFHCHNDYGLATANCLAAVEAGARGVHTSVNGLGERAGNTRLAEVVAALHDHGPWKTGVNEKKLVAVSRLVEIATGKEVSANAPIVGADVFTQTAGIHADGDAKGDLYESRLAPARFGRQRAYALGKLSGKASIDQNLAKLGIELSTEARDAVLARVVELGDKKRKVMPEDLRFLIADVLKTPREQLMRVASYEVTVGSDATPSAHLTLAYGKQRATASATGDGGYDAFMKALAKAAKKFGLALPELRDFRVRIAPGGETDALVETIISWRGEGGAENWSTMGVDSDQLAAAVLATEKMLNQLLADHRRRS
ncbi:MAG: 2-isopropylmalate synthase [Deltaproteobacteria bacterium]|nr:2-isopropylmalate synthase [Deltaproteobacteria bacterium]